MLASVLISFVSLVLFVYWFRYTCVFLLQNRADGKFALAVAAANRLSFLEVRQRLSFVQASSAMDELQSALERDYQILHYLLEHSSGQGYHSLERRLMTLDYKLMRLWYRLVRRSSTNQARLALEEMSGILGYFAQQLA